MSYRSHFGSQNIPAKLAMAVAIATMVLGSAWAAMTASVTAQSGVPLYCHAYWRVDAQGREWPVSIQFLSRPANGTVRAQVTSEPRALRNGTTKTVRVAHLVYQSRKGFVGQDMFTYRRVSGDPTDPDNNKEYTIAVTVR
jgi:hypothetical protein